MSPKPNTPPAVLALVLTVLPLTVSCFEYSSPTRVPEDRAIKVDFQFGESRTNVVTVYIDYEIDSPEGVADSIVETYFSGVTSEEKGNIWKAVTDNLYPRVMTRRHTMSRKRFMEGLGVNGDEIYEKLYKEQVLTHWGLVDEISKGNREAYHMWEALQPAYNCPERARLGSLGDGGKWVCSVQRLVERGDDCVVYGYGTGGEMSFEEDIRTLAPHCTVVVFEVMPWDWEPGFATEKGMVWQDVGLAGRNGEMQGRDQYDRVRTLKLETLYTTMTRLGHRHIDILKVDIDGMEFDAFANILNVTNVPEEARRTDGALPIDEIIIEVTGEGISGAGVKKVRDLFWRLEEHGYRPFHSIPNWASAGRIAQQQLPTMEYSFIREGLVARTSGKPDFPSHSQPNDLPYQRSSPKENKKKKRRAVTDLSQDYVSGH